jgi:hypothetical protein
MFSSSSVADPGCLFRIPNPIFPSRIQGLEDPGSRFRFRIKEFNYFNPKKLFISSRKYDLWYSSQIPDPELDIFPTPDTNPGSE